MLHPTVFAALEAATQTSHHTSRIALPVAGAVCAAASLILMIKRKSWRRTQAVLLLVTGLALAGWAGRVRTLIEGWLSTGSASATAKILGVSVSYVAALIIVLWFALDMDLDGLANKARRKGGGKTNRHTTSALTPWLALFVPVALAALPYVGGIPDAVTARIG